MSVCVCVLHLQCLQVSFPACALPGRKIVRLLRRGRGRAWPQELTSLPAAVSTSCGREAVVGWSPEAYRGERKC